MIVCPDYPIAIIAHEGAVANGGHYVTFVKQSVLYKSSLAVEDGHKWYKFDDDDVTILSKDDLSTLYGGGAFLSFILVNLRF